MQVQRPQQRRNLRYYIGSLFSSIWSTIRYVFTLGGAGNAQPNANIQMDFDCGEAIANDDRLLASLEIDKFQTFFKTCIRSRRRKKPMLVLVMQNPDDQLQVDRVIQTFVEGSAITQDLLKAKYTLMVVSQDQLESKLKNSQAYFRLHHQDDLTLFILFIKVEAQVSVIHRVRQADLLDQNTFANRLQEYAGLFDFMAEEDPEYRAV